MGGAANIPLSEVLAYCHLTGIRNEEEIDELLHFIGVLDSAWLEAVNKKG